MINTAEKYRKAIRILYPDEEMEPEIDAVLKELEAQGECLHVRQNFRLGEIAEASREAIVDESIQTHEYTVGPAMDTENVLSIMEERGIVLDAVKDNLSKCGKKEQQAFRAILPGLTMGLVEDAGRAKKPLETFLQDPSEVQAFFSRRIKHDIETFPKYASRIRKLDIDWGIVTDETPVIYDWAASSVDYLRHADIVLPAFGIKEDLGKIAFPELPRRQQKEAAAAFQAYAEDDLTFKDIPYAEYLEKKTESFARLHAGLPKKLQEDVTKPLLRFARDLGEYYDLPRVVKAAEPSVQTQK